jgi:hypothetical protein
LTEEKVMPKEVIRDNASMFDVAVAWSAEKTYVQVGITTHEGYPIARMLGLSSSKKPVSEWPEPEPGRFVPEVKQLSPVESANGETEDEAAQFTGLWGTFDRHQINQLIRVLRRARNSAYGADE